MKMIILGFEQEDEELLAAEMEKLIVDSQCYLFTIVCGSQLSAGYRWAKRNGCPVEFCSNQALPHDIDFVLVKINDKTPSVIKNYIMKLKVEGKHGRIIK